MILVRLYFTKALMARGFYKRGCRLAPVPFKHPHSFDLLLIDVSYSCDHFGSRLNLPYSKPHPPSLVSSGVVPPVWVRRHGELEQMEISESNRSHLKRLWVGKAPVL